MLSLLAWLPPQGQQKHLLVYLKYAKQTTNKILVREAVLSQGTGREGGKKPQHKKNPTLTNTQAFRLVKATTFNTFEFYAFTVFRQLR